VGSESGRLFQFEPRDACVGLWTEAVSPLGPGTAFSGIVHEGGASWLVGGRALSGQWPSTATPGLWRTRDGGATWQRFEDGCDRDPRFWTADSKLRVSG
jgi:photosystem II stability/assembly factor-like uncharacterized protein